jgi:hypothetical protein
MRGRERDAGESGEVEARPAPRDWRETVRAAADFALLGFAVTLAALPVVTLGAAVATGSFATDRWFRERSMPGPRELGMAFLRGILPGLGATLVALAGGVLLGVDLGAVGRGAVPGGTPMFVLSLVVAAQFVGLAALAVVGVGAGGGWLAAVAWAGRAAMGAPLVPTALAVVVAVAVLLGVLIPVTSPILAGFVLFALHVVARRMAGERPR